MDQARKGEIAYELLQHILLKRGAHLNEGVIRQLGNVAKETGIPIDELKVFAKDFMDEVVEKVLAPKEEPSDDQGEASAS